MKVFLARVFASVALLGLALVFVESTAASAAGTGPTTAITSPSIGGNLQGTSALLDASASAPPAGVASVTFYVSDYSTVYFGKNNPFCGATLSIYGWVCTYDTANVPSGTYTLYSQVVDNLGLVGKSATQRITINGA